MSRLCCRAGCGEAACRRHHEAQHAWEDPVPINTIKSQPAAPLGMKKQKITTTCATRSYDAAVPEEYGTSMTLSRTGPHCHHGTSLPSTAFILFQGSDAMVLSRAKTLVLPLHPALQDFQTSVAQINRCWQCFISSTGCP